MATNKIGRNVRKYGKWVGEHKFAASKEHRGCGPLGYYLRYRKDGTTYYKPGRNMRKTEVSNV